MEPIANVSETRKEISFEVALTAVKTIIEFIEQQPDNSSVAIFNLQRWRRSIKDKQTRVIIIKWIVLMVPFSPKNSMDGADCTRANLSLLSINMLNILALVNLLVSILWNLLHSYKRLHRFLFAYSDLLSGKVWDFRFTPIAYISLLVFFNTGIFVNFQPNVTFMTSVSLRGNFFAQTTVDEIFNQQIITPLMSRWPS
jgi:hypothetical protein